MIHRMRNLQDNGLPMEGSYMEEGDVVIGKVRKYKGEEIYAGLSIGAGDEGIVHRIKVGLTAKKNMVVRVMIRQIRKPEVGDKFASRSAQKGTISLILAPEDIPIIASGPDAGITPDIIINAHCLTGDTLVSLGHGVSRRIDTLSKEGGEMVLSWNGKDGFIKSKQIGLEPKGVKDIIRITLEDGHTLKCTPDHKILTVKEIGGEKVYEWVEAGKLKTIGKVENDQWIKNTETPCKVLLGPEYPEDIIGEDEKDWKLELYDGSVMTMIGTEREKTLAFARLLGLILSDGCISKLKGKNYYVSNVCLGHDLDVKECLDDVILLTGCSPSVQSDEYCYSFRIPDLLAMKYAMLPGMTIGKKTEQEQEWPEFLLDQKCPLSILREFLGGLFGGDGNAPYLRHNKAEHVKSKEDCLTLHEIAFSLSCSKEYGNSMIDKMNQLIIMLSKFEIKAKLCKSRVKGYGESNARWYEKYRNKTNLNPEFKENIDIVGEFEKINIDSNLQDKEEINKESHEIKFLENTSFIFYKKIGFRYCTQKLCRLYSASSYWNYISKIKSQHDKIIQRTDYSFDNNICKSLKDSLKLAQTELLKNEAPLNDHYSLLDIQIINNRRRTKGRIKTLQKLDYNFIKRPDQYFSNLGILDWFWIEGVTGKKRTYIVDHKMDYIPFISLQVLETRAIGKEEVYDISVLKSESFLGNGLCVHNCLPSRMTLGKIIEIIASKVGMIRGELSNATSFRPIQHDDFRTALKAYGFDPKGNERMINPLTGELFDSEIFVGPCYYSCLGKDVRDKIQARSVASINPSTHEPTKGRTNASGKAIRVGTQENTSFVGHGAPGILKERLNDSSDGFRTVYCKTCGEMATHNVDLKKIRCKKCGEQGDFGTSTIPGSFKYLSQILGGMNIRQSLGLGLEHEKFKP